MGLTAQLINRSRHCVRLQHAVMALSGLLILAFGISAIISLHRAYRQTLDDAAVTLESVARAAEVGTSRMIFEVDATLMGVERMLAALYPDAPLNGPEVKAFLRQVNEQNLSIRDVLILDEAGRQVNTGASIARGARSFADRPFFTAHRADGLPSLYIGVPERSRLTGGWSIMMSRPLMRGDRFAGVLAAEVPVHLVTDFFSSIITTGGTRLALLRADDGTLLAGEPHREEAIGRVASFAPRLLEQVARERAGFLESTQAEDEEPRLRAYRQLPARPLIISVSRDRDDILKGWYGERRATLAALLFFAITAAGLTWAVVRALERRQAAAAELRQSEERLEQQRALLQRTLEHMGEGLSVFDKEGRLVAWNKRFIELLDLPAELWSGTSLNDVLRIQAMRGDFGHTEDIEAVVHERFLSAFREIPATWERETSTGRTLQLRRHAMPDGGIVTLYSDITERKAAEREMIDARRHAELANRAKSEFLANMSHELRTPLNAVIGFSEVIKDALMGALDVRYRDYARDIHVAGNHLLALINDVLDLSKIEVGHLELHDEPLDLAELVRACRRLVAEKANEGGIKLSIQVPPDLPALQADARRMKQILLNLLSNALKFTPPGGQVSISVSPPEHGGIVIAVTDTGIGMRTEDIPVALEPFRQIDSALNRRFEGTGLGLPLVKRLTELHGGTLEIESTPGQGTAVYVRLPTERLLRNAAA